MPVFYLPFPSPQEARGHSWQRVHTRTHIHSTIGADFMSGTVLGNGFTAVSISFGPCLSNTYILTTETENHGIQTDSGKKQSHWLKSAQAAITEYHDWGSLHNIYFSQFWRLKSKIKALAKLVSGGALLLVCKQLSSPCILTWPREQALVSSYKDANPAWQGEGGGNSILMTLSKHNYIPNPPPDTVHWGLGFNT